MAQPLSVTSASRFARRGRGPERKWAASRRAFVADGSDNNWAIQRRFFGSWTAIIDFIHVLSYVFAAATAGRFNSTESP